MTTKVREKVSQRELPKLAGYMDYLKTMVEIERKVRGEESYQVIGQTMEDAINECQDISERLLYAGLEEA